MTGRPFLLPLTVMAALFSAAAHGAPSGPEICRKMIAEERNNGMTQAACECMHQVAKQVLDEDIQALLFDSWHNGTNNLSAIGALPNQPRVYRQLGRLERGQRRDCR